MRQFSTLKVIKRWNGKWAVIREIKGKQPIIIVEYTDEKLAKEKKRELEPAKRKKKRFSYPPIP